MQPLYLDFTRIAVKWLAAPGPVYQLGSPPLDLPGRARLRDSGGTVGRTRGARFGSGEETPLAVEIPYPDESAGSVLWLGSGEDFAMRESIMREVQRVLRPGGLLMLAAACGGGWQARGRRGAQEYGASTRGTRLTPARAEDGSTYSPGQVRALLGGFPLTFVGWQGRPQDPHSVYAAAFKPPLAESVLGRVNRFAGQLQEHLRGRARQAGWLARIPHQLLAWLGIHRLAGAEEYFFDFAVDIASGSRFGKDFARPLARVS